jgi:Tol biopolymer transport system component
VEKEMISCVALSHDGKLLAAAEIQSGGDMIGLNRVYLWDTTTGRELLNFQERQRLKGVQFSADGRRLVAIGGVGGFRRALSI